MTANDRTMVRFALPVGTITTGTIRAVPLTVADWLIELGVADRYVEVASLQYGTHAWNDAPLRLER